MYKTLILLLIPIIAFAQNSIKPSYVYLSDTKVFDIEIIIFAYSKALPNSQTYNNPPIFDNGNAVILGKKDSSLELFVAKDIKQDGLSIPIDENKSNRQALVWFEHNKDFYQLNTLYQKLNNKSGITPILHKAWRQAETPFESPQSVHLSTVNIPNSDNLEELLFPDYTLTGMVTLSKGRFLHFGHNLNLFRQFHVNGQTKNMVFTLTERRQLYPGELNYYDSPWLGSIVKITQVKGEKNE